MNYRACETVALQTLLRRRLGIYATGLVMNGCFSMRSRAKSRDHERKPVYAICGRSRISTPVFYRGTAAKDIRSLMNVTFRLPKEDLENRFVKASTAAGLDGLKGPRAVRRLRASFTLQAHS